MNPVRKRLKLSPSLPAVAAKATACRPPRPAQPLSHDAALLPPPAAPAGGGAEHQQKEEEEEEEEGESYLLVEEDTTDSSLIITMGISHTHTHTLSKICILASFS